MKRCLVLTVVVVSSFFLQRTAAQDKQQPKKAPIPHGQSAPPGPALSLRDAIKKMTVPPGFHVELVAAEPAIVNPVAMTFDERGRIWITESLEYPRRSAGPGRDRVKLLESTKGDGTFDKITTVIEGLNIPSGIAVGHGGVWIANSPDILFYPFKDFAAAKLGSPEVVVTGFGRFDTHELPNSLTWGPDGWLYGLNGVFNPAHIKYRGKDFKFTCALFRIHPGSRDFEVFCEGTSNPWGIAIDGEGSFFVSACVIDHLWHLVETGYYHRQGGPYPPYTWQIGSIVKHKHQQAAYCGITWFDSDAYPPEYREKLYMGNIHGNCINSDELTRDGSTYFAKPRPDFLSANDAWFMPVSQKTGPDGCLYILDWYDRYHCYQDAERDPAGIDRLNGRLYRVVYKDFKPAGTFDMSTETSERLIQRSHSANVYDRETAQRILCERCWHTELFLNGSRPRSYRAVGLSAELQKLAFSQAAPRKARLHALWTLVGAQTTDDEFLLKLLDHKDANFRAIGVRAAGNRRFFVEAPIVKKLLSMAGDHLPDVQLQVAIAIPKLSFSPDVATDFKKIDAMPVLFDVLTHCGDDKLIPHIVWQNLHPLLEKNGARFLDLAGKVDLAKAPGLAKMLPRAIDRILANLKDNSPAVVAFIEKLASKDAALPGKEFNVATLRACLAALTVRIQNHEIADKQLDALRDQLKPILQKLGSDPHSSLAADIPLLLTVMKDPDSLARARQIFGLESNTDEYRLRAMSALIAAGEANEVLQGAEAMLRQKRGSAQFRGQILSQLGAINDRGVADRVLRLYGQLEPELQRKAIELLTQRPVWAKALFGEIAEKKLPKNVININQARRLLAAKDAELRKLVGIYWGIPRDSRNPEREKVAAEMKALFKKTPGDPRAGAAVFKKTCAQCHRLYGEGVEVGPDLTSNGRSDFDQLLSNIFDPSLVIGAGYQAVTVNTTKGQVISGLLVENNPERVVLKIQGGEVKTIARKDVEEQFTSKVSLMPEDLDKQLKPSEIVDLLSYLSLDKPPDDPKARKIPGTPR